MLSSKTLLCVCKCTNVGTWVFVHVHMCVSVCVCVCEPSTFIIQRDVDGIGTQNLQAGLSLVLQEVVF